VEDDILADPVDKLVDDRIGDDLRGLVDLERHLAANIDLTVDGIERQVPFVDVPFADQLRIVLLLEPHSRQFLTRYLSRLSQPCRDRQTKEKNQLNAAAKQGFRNTNGE
jgi:hypothetical protein